MNASFGEHINVVVETGGADTWHTDGISSEQQEGSALNAVRNFMIKKNCLHWRQFPCRRVKYES